MDLDRDLDVDLGIDMRLEVVVVPVADVDRANRFYRRLGFRSDLDYATGTDFRIVRWTPPGSQCSIVLGKGVTAAPAGSSQGLQLAVPDVAAARRALVARGVDVGPLFEDVAGEWPSARAGGPRVGPGARRGTRASFASFSDPDGNGWLLHEVRRVPDLRWRVAATS